MFLTETLAHCHSFTVAKHTPYIIDACAPANYYRVPTRSCRRWNSWQPDPATLRAAVQQDDQSRTGESNRVKWRALTDNTINFKVLRPCLWSLQLLQQQLDWCQWLACSSTCCCHAILLQTGKFYEGTDVWYSPQLISALDQPWITEDKIAALYIVLMAYHTIEQHVSCLQ